MEVIGTMEVVKVSTVPEFVEGMRKYTEQIPFMERSAAHAALIRIGVLDEQGRPKKQICTGDGYDE